MDVYLVEGTRPQGPGYAPNTDNAYYCLCSEKDVKNCTMQSHPERQSLPFKLKLVNCASCGSDLGNVQDASLILNGEWQSRLGHMVMCFKCQNVLLELPHWSAELVEVKKWSILYAVLAEDCRLSIVTKQFLARQIQAPLNSHMAMNSGKGIRFVPARRSCA